jgi:hypothetical protein
MALKAFAPISNPYPEGTWQHDDHHETQAFSQAMSRVKPGDRLSPGYSGADVGSCPDSRGDASQRESLRQGMSSDAANASPRRVCRPIADMLLVLCVFPRLA